MRLGKLGLVESVPLETSAHSWASCSSQGISVHCITSKSYMEQRKRAKTGIEMSEALQNWLLVQLGRYPHLRHLLWTPSTRSSGPCGHHPRLGEGKQPKTHGKRATLNSSGAFAYPPPPCSQVNCSPVTSGHISRACHIHAVGRWAQQQRLNI